MDADIIDCERGKEKIGSEDEKYNNYSKVRRLKKKM